MIHEVRLAITTILSQFNRRPNSIYNISFKSILLCYIVSFVKITVLPSIESRKGSTHCWQRYPVGIVDCWHSLHITLPRVYMCLRMLIVV